MQRLRPSTGRFQSTSSVWRTTTLTIASDTGPQAISIHVLRVEDDRRPVRNGHYPRDFNPRPPCGGRRVQIQQRKMQENFNPRPPCGGRPTESRTSSHISRFQSTSSVWRTTTRPWFSRLRRSLFQSTSSVWRTTIAIASDTGPQAISIHVLRVEDDAGAADL